VGPCVIPLRWLRASRPVTLG